MYLIVGIDPGTTTGIAILNIEGRLLESYSSKNLGLEKTIEHIIGFGTVSVIASDVSPTPEFVSKLASRLGSKVYCPKESLHVDEKILLTKDYKVEDSHQRDALAAALVAFNKYKNKFQKIDSLKLGDEIKHKVLHGYSIESAIKEKEKVKKPVKKIEKKIEKKTTLSEEEKRLRALEKRNRALIEQIADKEREIKLLKDQLLKIRNRYSRELREEQEIVKRELVIDSLKAKVKKIEKNLKSLEKLKKLWSGVISGEITPVAIFPEMAGGITYIKSKIRKSDEDRLRNVRVVFVDKSQRVLSKMDVLILDSKYLKEIVGCYYIENKELEGLTKRDVSIDEIISDYRTKRTKS